MRSFAVRCPVSFENKGLSYTLSRIRTFQHSLYQSSHITNKIDGYGHPTRMMWLAPVGSLCTVLPCFLWSLQRNIKVNLSFSSSYFIIIFLALLQFLDSVLRVTGRRITVKQLCWRMVYVCICLVLKVSEAVSRWMKLMKTPPLFANHCIYPVLLVIALCIFRVSKINPFDWSFYFFYLLII